MLIVPVDCLFELFIKLFPKPQDYKTKLTIETIYHPKIRGLHLYHRDAGVICLHFPSSLGSKPFKQFNLQAVVHSSVLQTKNSHFITNRILNRNGKLINVSEFEVVCRTHLMAKDYFFDLRGDVSGGLYPKMFLYIVCRNTPVIQHLCRNTPECIILQHLCRNTHMMHQ